MWLARAGEAVAPRLQGWDAEPPLRACAHFTAYCTGWAELAYASVVVCGPRPPAQAQLDTLHLAARGPTHLLGGRAPGDHAPQRRCEGGLVQRGEEQRPVLRRCWWR